VRSDVRLTELSHGAGCACKLGPGELAEVLGHLGTPAMPEEVLVSAETGDDAAVYRLPDGQALVQTADFFTPIVDDAYDWGRVGAANAISDVYAMGARPVLALNLAGWPVDDLPLEMLGRVLEGGSAVAAQAGVAVVGGHTITDVEPKYGMAVTGLAPVEQIVRNSTARPGAHLFLTKPLGIGIITTAIKRRMASDRQIEMVVDVMTELNAAASEAMVEAGAQAATDVTGFGLLGHLRGMLAASGCSATLDAGAVDVLPGALDLAEKGAVAGGTRRNLDFVVGSVAWGDLPEAERVVLADAQTSGGLLIAIDDPDRLAQALERRGIPPRMVGVVEDGPAGRVTVTGRVSRDGSHGGRIPPR
jgi:selenide, water dikinase